MNLAGSQAPPVIQKFKAGVFAIYLFSFCLYWSLAWCLFGLLFSNATTAGAYLGSSFCSGIFWGAIYAWQKTNKKFRAGAVIVSKGAKISSVIGFLLYFTLITAGLIAAYYKETVVFRAKASNRASVSITANSDWAERKSLNEEANLTILNTSSGSVFLVLGSNKFDTIKSLGGGALALLDASAGKNKDYQFNRIYENYFKNTKPQFDEFKLVSNFTLNNLGKTQGGIYEVKGNNKSQNKHTWIYCLAEGKYDYYNLIGIADKSRKKEIETIISIMKSFKEDIISKSNNDG